LISKSEKPKRGVLFQPPSTGQNMDQVSQRYNLAVVWCIYDNIDIMDVYGCRILISMLKASFYRRCKRTSNELSMDAKIKRKEKQIAFLEKEKKNQLKRIK
jgi:hypothetical protein